MRTFYIVCEMNPCGNCSQNNNFDIFSEIIVLNLKVCRVKLFINFSLCECTHGNNSFVSLFSVLSAYILQSARYT